jgi:predicted PurR-regulated permease PerM
MRPLNETARFWAAVISICVTIMAVGLGVILMVGEISEEVAVLTERVDNLNETVQAAALSEQRRIDTELRSLEHRLTILEKE